MTGLPVKLLLFYSMDLKFPLHVIAPGLEAEILQVLACTTASFTGRSLARMLPHRSPDGIRLALERLDQQGLLNVQSAGRAYLYSLNRSHLAAPSIQALANLRSALIDRLSQTIQAWPLPPVLAVLFGSIARSDCHAKSDIDLLLVRPDEIDTEDPQWETQSFDLATAVYAWTGNRLSPITYSLQELQEHVGQEPFLENVRQEGICLAGDATLLDRLTLAQPLVVASSKPRRRP